MSCQTSNETTATVYPSIESNLTTQNGTDNDNYQIQDLVTYYNQDSSLQEEDEMVAILLNPTTDKTVSNFADIMKYGHMM